MTIFGLWARIDKSGGPDACWPWSGVRNRQGYGKANLPEVGVGVLVHRHVHYLMTGLRPPVVMHKCDNPPCCNPSHLTGGTQTDNTKDRDVKGRQRALSGELNHGSKLTWAQVEEIRRRHVPHCKKGPSSSGSLAKEFGVDRTTIHAVASYECWRTPPTPPNNPPTTSGMLP
jgi:hypothetical protein